MLVLAVALTFMAIFLLAVVLLSMWGGFRRSPMRLMRGRLTAGYEAKTTVRVFRDDAMSALPALHRWLSHAVLARKLEKYLEQADISQRVGTVLGSMLLLAIIGGRLLWSLTSSFFWSAAGVGAFGSFPLMYVLRQRRVRLSRYGEQLPDALDILTRSLQAGLSFLQGLQAVAREMPEPARTEFQKTFEELRLGRSLRDALQSHADRIENLDFNLLATALLIQREAGGNLTEVLDNTSTMIRERYKLLGQVRALSAQNRLAGRIIGALPFAIALMMYLLRPDLLMVLFKEEIGRTLMAIAVVMQIMGFYVMKRIMTIKI